MSELICVWVNCASEEEATKIAEEAVKRRLAACSNIHAMIVSAYLWQGRVENNHEVPLLLKTRVSLFDQLAQLVEEIHSYEMPGIIGIPARRINAAYEEWVINETKWAADRSRVKARGRYAQAPDLRWHHLDRRRPGVARR